MHIRDESQIFNSMQIIFLTILSNNYAITFDASSEELWFHFELQKKMLFSCILFKFPLSDSTIMTGSIYWEKSDFTLHML